MEEVNSAAPVELLILLVLAGDDRRPRRRRVALPYSVALVLAGLAIAVLVRGRRIEVTPELILAVMIPGLVFQAAYKLDVTELRRTFGDRRGARRARRARSPRSSSRWSSRRHGPRPRRGVRARGDHLGDGPGGRRLAVQAARRAERLATLVDAESLLNDGTGVVLFGIALAALAQPVSLADGVVRSW